MERTEKTAMDERIMANVAKLSESAKMAVLGFVNGMTAFGAAQGDKSNAQQRGGERS